MPLIRKSPQGLGPPPNEHTVLRALADGNEDERWAAARAAAELPNSVAALRSAVAHETSPRVREALFTALVRLATPQCVEAIMPLLRSDDADVRTGAVDALAAMRDATWPYLAALLRDTDVHVRILACELLRNLPAERAVPLLCEVLESEPEANVCAAAVDALAEIGGAASLPALTRCAERFRATPFLQFAIGVAVDRLRSQTPQPRG